MTPPSSCSYTTSNSFDETSCQAGEWIVKTYDHLTQPVLPLVQKDLPTTGDAFVGAVAGIAAGAAIRGMHSVLVRSAAQTAGKAAVAGAAGAAAGAAGTTFAPLTLGEILFFPFTFIDELPQFWGGDKFSDSIAQGLETMFGPAPSWLVSLADDLGL